MMRIVSVLLLWVIALGSLHAYMKSIEPPLSRTVALSGATGGAVAPAQEGAAESSPEYAAAGGYSIEATATCEVEPDPFALATDGSEAPAALRVQEGDRKILTMTGGVEPGAPVLAGLGPDWGDREREFFAEANMPLDFAGRSCALRLRLLRDSAPLTEETLWTDGGNRIAGTFRVSPVEAGAETGEGAPRHE